MKSRSQKALWNTTTDLALQLVTALCGFILPRLVLSSFGSSYNGIVHSITQFIGCIELLKSGIGSVTRVALYKPLAENDFRGISQVVNTTERFMRRIACIFLICILLFALVYPFLVPSELSWEASSSLVLILSISTFAQYFFGITYQMLLQADQSVYIISLIQIVTTIANTAVSAVLMLAGCSIHAVKLGSALVFLIPPVFYYLYVRRRYHIDKHVPVDNSLISQRWDAFGHQIANFLNMNTTVMAASLCLGVIEVSVYTIYNLVVYSIRKIVLTLTNGVAAAFGNMMAKQESDVLSRRFGQFELLMYIASATVFITAALLFVPFVMVYTEGITDADYSRPALAVLLCISTFFSCVKMPYETVVFAAGKFKQTKNAAFVEAGITVTASLGLVWVWGLNGLIVGMILSGMYRTIVYNAFVAKEIFHTKGLRMLFMWLYSAVCATVCGGVLQFMPLAQIDSYASWFLWAFIVFVCVAVMCVLIAVLMFRRDAVDLICSVWRVIFGRVMKGKRRSA